MKPRPFLVGIAGGSGSGKTTLARALVEKLGAERCLLISQDSYYIDQSARFDGDGGSVNFDHPASLDFALMAEHLAALRAGMSVQIPVYDFTTHKRLSAATKADPRPLVLVDGILIFSQPALRSLFDFMVFVEAPETLRYERRLQRDTRERGRTAEGVHKQFQAQVKPMHDQFVEPSRAHAHLVLSGQMPIAEGVAEVMKFLAAKKT